MIERYFHSKTSFVIELNSSSDAYRASYQVGEATKSATVNNSAYKLLQKGEITARINELSEAYRASYQVGEDTKPESVHNMASRLLQKVEVRYRLNELREANRAKFAITIQSITREIERAQSLAYETQNPSALVSALMGKAKLHGLLVDKSKQKVEHTVNRDLDTLMAEIDGQ